MLISDIKSDFSFEKILKFCHKETGRIMTSENLEYSLTTSLLW